MDTFYIRHTGKLDVDAATLDRLFLERRIGIHYPQRDEQNLNSDIRSVNPDDYMGKSRKPMQALADLAHNGGYLFAKYRSRPTALVGRVLPKTQIELFEGYWGSLEGRVGQLAVLKTLVLTNAWELPHHVYSDLIRRRTVSGTISRWSCVGDTVAQLVNRLPA